MPTFRSLPVIRESRASSFFWVQRIIRTDDDRTLLYDLDTAIQPFAKGSPGTPSLLNAQALTTT
jgi:PKHD-type hydroxylase